MIISVVIPLYNKKESIAHTLECVLKQTYQNFEVVVVDDGSTDGSAEIVEGVDDGRIRLIRQENGGVSAARNRGIKEAKSEYIAFLDADDEWKPEHLETLVGLIEKYPQCGAYSTNYEFDRNGVVESAQLNKVPFEGNNGVLSNYFEVASCSHPPVCSITVCIKKSLFNEIGSFPIGIKSGEDLITWARIAVRTDWAYSMKQTAVYIVEGYSINERPKRMPAELDFVGDELMSIRRNNPSIKGLRRYTANWFKMRASVYMRLGMKGKSMKEIWKALKLTPFNYKLYAYILLNLINIYKFRKLNF